MVSITFAITTAFSLATAVMAMPAAPSASAVEAPADAPPSGFVSKEEGLEQVSMAYSGRQLPSFLLQ